MALLVSSRFDEIEQAMHGMDGRYLLKSRSTREWRLGMETFGDLAAMVGTNGADVVYEGAMPAAFMMLVGNGFSSVNGERLASCRFIWVPPGDEFQALSACGLRWMTIVVPASCVRRWVDSDLVRLDPRFLRYTVGCADVPTLRRLVGLVIDAAKAVASSAEAGTSDRCRRAANAEMADAVLDTLRSAQATSDARRGRPRLDGRRIAREVGHFVDRHLDQAVRIDDVCSTVGISATALQKIAHQHLGMSLHQYLTLRRLHAVHAALRDADRPESISSICSSFGIWDFGRFATRYRQLFGALPSRAREAAGRRRAIGNWTPHPW